MNTQNVNHRILRKNKKDKASIDIIKTRKLNRNLGHMTRGPNYKTNVK